ncbi:hypothetical protein QR680_018426 [Steinernema hermaphroditum]|uniref:PDZ domain-containing protein n=1 Tax=Steinernema hermaphroditum TaxID=289476 RepID=A0AA39HK65_9BILA|nr:hypothetical protein QR680_018426 [Steinernema hermaphroditum]
MLASSCGGEVSVAEAENLLRKRRYSVGSEKSAVKDKSDVNTKAPIQLECGARKPGKMGVSEDDQMVDIPTGRPDPPAKLTLSQHFRSFAEWLLLLLCLCISFHLWSLLLKSDDLCFAPSMDPAQAWIDASASSASSPDNNVHSGMVLISDGKGRGRPARLQLTKDQLTIQVPVMSESESDSASPAVQEVDSKPRTVTLQRAKGGLGLSIKGGQDGNQVIPIVISKLMIGLPAEQSGQLYVGDTILTINGVSVEGKTHDDVVQMLKDAGAEVTLTVKNNPQIAPFVKSGSLKSRRSGSALDRMYETNTWKSALKQQVDTDRDAQQAQKDDDNEGWKTITKIPLPMAFVTRYLWGTDKIRHNQFEVRAVDGKSTGIVHCEDKSALEQWIKHIQTHINAVNQKSIKMSNKYLHPSEQISYIGWVEERMPEGYFEDPKQRWEPRFVIFKGSDFCMFESPPLNSEDLEKCICLYKTFETALKVASYDGIRRDRREHTCWIETAEHNTHYLSLGSSQLFKQFENAYNTCVYKSVTAIQL